jgi:hypothetical protein
LDCQHAYPIQPGRKGLGASFESFVLHALGLAAQSQAREKADEGNDDNKLSE